MAHEGPNPRKSVKFKRNRGLLTVSIARSRAPSQREPLRGSPNYLFEFVDRGRGPVGALLDPGSEVNAISLEYARKFGCGHPSY